MKALRSAIEASERVGLLTTKVDAAVEPSKSARPHALSPRTASMPGGVPAAPAPPAEGTASTPVPARLGPAIARPPPAHQGPTTLPPSPPTRYPLPESRLHSAMHSAPGAGRSPRQHHERLSHSAVPPRVHARAARPRAMGLAPSSPAVYISVGTHSTLTT
jgi:hypothetical protein